jgi:DNA-binding CsgD family transcriptional regulator
MQFDPDVLATTLAPLAARLPGGDTLTPSERTEVLRLAQGFACKDSAVAGNVSPETIRARRKRIYRKLGLGGSNELISALLASSLQMLAGRERAGASVAGATQTGDDAAAGV